MGRHKNEPIMNLITKEQAARMIGGDESPVSISYINQLIARKKLPTHRMSYRVTRIPRESVEEFISSRLVKAR